MRAAPLLALVLVACGSEAGPPPAATPAPERAPVRTPAEAEPPHRVAILWSVEEPRRAARRLRALPAVTAVARLGRRVALLRAGADRRGHVVERVRAGYAVPLDVLAVAPRAYARTLPAADRAAFAGGPSRPLGRREAILSETSSRLRGIGRGGVLHLAGGARLRVRGVVPDRVVRDAEVAVAGVRASDRPSLVAVLRAGARVDPEALARRAERGSAARVLPSGPGPDGPADPVELKARFGEPAVRLPYGDDWVRLDPAFVRRHLVTRRVPILGSVTCHRRMIGPLRRALAELERRELARLVDPDDYAGCYAPRRIRPGGALSLHAWGLAVDLNAAANPFGERSRQDRRLVRTMRRHGFSWGGDWPTIRDPMHFEYRGRIEAAHG